MAELCAMMGAAARQKSAGRVRRLHEAPVQISDPGVGLVARGTICNSVDQLADAS
jgi:hypothetical protein